MFMLNKTLKLFAILFLAVVTIFVGQITYKKLFPTKEPIEENQVEAKRVKFDYTTIK